MWCKYCGQDVPAISSSATSAARCARCGALSDRDSESPDVFSGPAESSAPPMADLANLPPGVETLPTLEDWTIDQSFRHLQAQLGISGGGNPTRSMAALPGATRRIDGPHAMLRGRHHPQAFATTSSTILAWTLLSVGLMSFTCGATLLVWSIIENRPELWNVGMPMAAGGQLGLVLGLIVQLERVWRAGRRTLEKLAQVDEQLDVLEQSTKLLGMTHSSASQAFYAHMAEQANPHLLLADLKGQLDLLAANLAKRQG